MGNKMTWLKLSEYVPDDDFTVLLWNKWAGYYTGRVSVEDGEISVRDTDDRWVQPLDFEEWTIIVYPGLDEEIDPMEFAITPEEAIRQWKELEDEEEEYESA